MAEETQRDDDYKQRVRDVERALIVVGLKLAGMESEMAVVKEGVSNFRDFQRTNLEFMGWFKATVEQDKEDKEREDKEREKREAHDKEERDKKEKLERDERETNDSRRARLHYWWLAILSGVIIGSVLGIGSWLIKFIATHHISQIVSSATTQDVKLPPMR